MTSLKLLSTSALILGLSLVTACKAPAPETQAVKAPAAVEKPVVMSLAEVIANPRRDEDRARDKFRNPQGTLDFFEITPGKAVAEIWPGWYTKILAPYAAATGGTYTAVLLPDGINDRLDARNAAFKETYADTQTYGTLNYGVFTRTELLGVPDNSQDVILTFRNVHNWMGSGSADPAFQAFYKAIKPGGILGVVEHRLPESAVQDPKAKSGYVQESYMKALAKDAGFEFVGSSEINANPRDTADHPYGVWTLPPRSRGPKDDDADKDSFNADLYKNIGESDRATLKFRKPL